jgi:hypothetical protein
MNSHNREPRHDGTQGRELANEPLRLPPTPSRLYRVAAGLAQWTEAEEVWMLENPAWVVYELELRAALADSELAIDEEAVAETIMTSASSIENDWRI